MKPEGYCLQPGSVRGENPVGGCNNAARSTVADPEFATSTMATLKSKSLMGPAKRFELWLVYSAAYSFVALCVLWNIGDAVNDPLARLLFVGQLILAFAVIAVLIPLFYDKEGKRIRQGKASAASSQEVVAS
jgi:hypothetical protein